MITARPLTNAGTMNSRSIRGTELLPFSPHLLGVSLYYPYVFFPFSSSRSRFSRIAWLTRLISGGIFVLCVFFRLHDPSGYSMSPIRAQLFAKLIYDLDPGYKIFPSLHVAHVFLGRTYFFKLAEGRGNGFDRCRGSHFPLRLFVKQIICGCLRRVFFDPSPQPGASALKGYGPTFCFEKNPDTSRLLIRPR